MIAAGMGVVMLKTPAGPGNARPARRGMLLFGQTHEKPLVHGAAIDIADREDAADHLHRYPIPTVPPSSVTYLNP